MLIAWSHIVYPSAVASALLQAGVPAIALPTVFVLHPAPQLFFICV
jgi:hypothetical protein